MHRCTVAPLRRPPWRPLPPLLPDGGRAVGVWPEPTAQVREISAWKLIHFSILQEARSHFSHFCCLGLGGNDCCFFVISSCGLRTQNRPRALFRNSVSLEATCTAILGLYLPVSESLNSVRHSRSDTTFDAIGFEKTKGFSSALSWNEWI